MSTDSDQDFDTACRTADILVQFQECANVDRPHVDNLWETLQRSNDLFGKLDELVERNLVTAIQPLDNEDAAAKYFAGNGSLHLGLRELGDEFNRHSLTFTLGHELQHAFDRELLINDQRNFEYDAMHQGQRKRPDYTSAIRGIIESTRKVEARAHIGGWNTLVNTLRQEQQGGATPPDLMTLYRSCPERMVDFMEVDSRRMHRVDGYRLKSGIFLNFDMTMSMDSMNTDAMAGYYADKRLRAPFGFGDQRSGDYRHSVATGRLNMIIGQFDYGRLNDRGKAPEISLNMHELGLSNKEMHEVGIDLHGGTTPLKIIDHSVKPAIEHFFRATKSAAPGASFTAGGAQATPSIGRLTNSNSVISHSSTDTSDRRSLQPVRRHTASRGVRKRQ